jgi:predicted SnoaL-like aldol condensation-catalyzing enzyme
MATSATQNKQIVREYLEQVWNEKHHARIGEFIAEDLVQHNPHLPNGQAAITQFLSGFAQNVPQGHFEIKRLIAEDDLVVAHSHFKPTPDARGMAVVDVFRIAEGRIVEHWDVSAEIPETSQNGNPVV